MLKWILTPPVVMSLLGVLSLAGCAASDPMAASNSTTSILVPAASARLRESRTAAASETIPNPDCDVARKNSDGTPKRAPAGPPSHPPETLVLAYGDFGPQASADTLLGFEWWAWEGGGSWEICDAFDIRVVVFRGLPLNAVKKSYPSATSKEDLVDRKIADYRYIEYTAALAHIDRELLEIAGVPELARMAQTLRTTRLRIVDGLGQ